MKSNPKDVIALLIVCVFVGPSLAAMAVSLMDRVLTSGPMLFIVIVGGGVLLVRWLFSGNPTPTGDKPKEGEADKPGMLKQAAANFVKEKAKQQATVWVKRLLK